MLESTPTGGRFCNICAHEWELRAPSVVPFHDSGRTERRTPNAEPRYASLEDFVTRTGVRRDELATLAEIGALNAFGFDRRSALWQIEKVVRPAGELFTPHSTDSTGDSETRQLSSALAGPHPRSLSLGGAADAALPSGASSFGKLRTTLSDVEGSLGPQALPEPPSPRNSSPLRPMNPTERLMADYAGTSLTIGPHPMAMRRAELALRGVLRATDLPRGRHGRRVRIAGAVITRQRPGTAKGFVFLTLEDETGIANIIVQPDLFTAHRSVIVGEPYLLIEGTLQIQEGVTSVKAERVIPLVSGGPDPQSHDFR